MNKPFLVTRRDEHGALQAVKLAPTLFKAQEAASTMVFDVIEDPFSEEGRQQQNAALRYVGDRVLSLHHGVKIEPLESL